jgi:CRISPR-associated endonuclease/helicase Cas3
MSDNSSPSAIQAGFFRLTGSTPFPWQEDLFARFSRGEMPTCCDIPTGLGKTSVIALWLLALAKFPDKMPRRLVYIVNRRTVVDQTKAEVEKIRRNLHEAGLEAPLRKLCSEHIQAEIPLAISTLRGQFADNREWSADPCRPAVIVGTVDMMGSRLLFGGYGIGFKTRPLHAGFLGQDTLIVHDEAHLEPAFQRLLTAIEREQERSGDERRVRVLELSATSRTAEIPFSITKADEHHPVVAARLGAVKRLALHEAGDAAALSKIIELATRHKESERAVLVFVQGVKDVEQIATALEKEVGKEKVERLTGTMRGLERERLIEKEVFKYFLPPDNIDPAKAPKAESTVYLVCTSAGEVGINISADHLVCDLSTFDSMAQRFGRVNRFGARTDTQVDVVHPAKFDETDEREQRRACTLALLRRLQSSASPNAIRGIPAEDRLAGFNPEPIILPVSDILFDTWSLTTITDRLPGRPPLAPYLRGLENVPRPETRVAWRKEVALINSKELVELYPPGDLLADYPLKPHELLRDNSARVWDALARMVSRDVENKDRPAWLVSDDGSVKVVTIGELADKQAKELIFGCTLLLPPKSGGLDGGMLNGSSGQANDVADDWFDENDRRRRARVWLDVPAPDGMRLIREIDLQQDEEEPAEEEDEVKPQRWRWFELSRSADSEGSRSARRPIPLADHTDDVEKLAKQFAEKSGLSPELIEAVALAGRFHDAGKTRRVWQLSIGNYDLDSPLAKSGPKTVPHQLGSYRHEFGSVLDLESPELSPEFQRLSEEMRDVVLHLVAAHHGRARPHFPANEIFDPQNPPSRAEALAAEAPRRFARLQRRYGRWGLAWLESLLRAADYAASTNPSKTKEEPL